MGWVFNTIPQPLYPHEWPSTHCVGGWVYIMANLAIFGNLCPHRD